MSKFFEELFAATMILFKEIIGFISYCWNLENRDKSWKDFPVTEAIAEKRLPRYETAVYELGLGKKFVSKKPSSRTCFVYFPIDNSILAGANYGFQPRTVDSTKKDYCG